MEYERIRKVQIGILSPTKLRMKLLGPCNSARKGGSHSSKTSPSKNDDMIYARNSLLSGDADEAESSKDITGAPTSDRVAKPDASRAEKPEKKGSSFSSGNRLQSNEKIDTNCVPQNFCASVPHQAHPNSNLSIIHPLRNFDEGDNFHNNGNDACSSFEFHRERTVQQPSLGLFYRHIPSKWNDAEKWIINRQTMNLNVKKKAFSQNHCSSTLQRVDVESTISELKPSIKQEIDGARNELSQIASQDIVEKFSFIPHGSNGKFAHCSDRTGDEMKRPVSEKIAVPTMQSVSMRDVGTEMTPVPTPLGSITPTRSSTSSLPSSPRPGAGSFLPIEDTKNMEQDGSESKDGRDKLSETEIRLKIRREIAALGIQLGKTSIASWATKEIEQCSTSPKIPNTDQRKKEYEVCAAAWEEAENTKHMARYKREEVKIQAWKSHQKAKLEDKMKNIEAKAEQMIARANTKMAEKLATTQHQVKEKQAAARARMSKQAARISQKAARIRRTGRIPSTNYLCCSGFF